VGSISTAPTRPFSPEYLHAYSGEHLHYEVDMFLWSAGLLSNPSTRLGGPTPADVRRFNFALIEGFVLHLRNLIDFFYPVTLRKTDVAAEDFFTDSAEWERVRPC